MQDVPVLLQRVSQQQDRWLRAYAAWCLAVLNPTEALPALRQADDREAGAWVEERMRLQIDEPTGG